MLRRSGAWQLCKIADFSGEREATCDGQTKILKSARANEKDEHSNTSGARSKIASTSTERERREDTAPYSTSSYCV